MTIYKILVALFAILLSGCTSSDYKVTPLPSDTSLNHDTKEIIIEEPVIIQGSSTLTEIRTCPLVFPGCFGTWSWDFQDESIPETRGKTVTVNLEWDNSQTLFGLNFTIYSGNWLQGHNVIYQAEGISPLNFSYPGVYTPTGVGFTGAFSPMSIAVNVTVHWKVTIYR